MVPDEGLLDKLGISIVEEKLRGQGQVEQNPACTSTEDTMLASLDDRWRCAPESQRQANIEMRIRETEADRAGERQ